MHLTWVLSPLPSSFFYSRLRQGSLERVTESTDMNAVSSRSHAIFTLYVTHRRTVERPVVGGDTAPAAGDDDGANDANSEGNAPSGEDGADGVEAVGNADGDPSTNGDSAPTVTDVITTTAKFNFVDLAVRALLAVQRTACLPTPTPFVAHPMFYQTGL